MSWEMGREGEKEDTLEYRAAATHWTTVGKILQLIVTASLAWVTSSRCGVGSWESTICRPEH